MRLFELCGKDRNHCFSPYVWRTKLALAHKGLAYESVPTRFLEKQPYAASGANRVPVLENDGEWVDDSWAIACYLERRFPDSKPLFSGPDAQAMAHFFVNWADFALVRGVFLIIVPDIVNHLTDEDAAYFRESREKLLRCKLEDMRERRDENRLKLHKNLAPMRAVLAEQPFISGPAPGYADYVAYGVFIWASMVSDVDLVTPQSGLAEWHQRMKALPFTPD